MQHFHLAPPQPCDNDFIVDFIARRSLRQVDDGWTWKFDPKVFLRDRQGIDDYLADIRCRIAVFKGQHSDLVTADVQDYMDELLGRSSPIVEIPAAYHHVPARPAASPSWPRCGRSSPTGSTRCRRSRRPAP